MDSQPPSGDGVSDVDLVVDSILKDNAAAEARRQQANVVYGPDTLADIVKTYAEVGWCAQNSVAIGQCLYDGCIGTTAHIVAATDADIAEIFAEAKFEISGTQLKQVIKALRSHRSVTDYESTNGMYVHFQEAVRQATLAGRSVEE